MLKSLLEDAVYETLHGRNPKEWPKNRAWISTEKVNRQPQVLRILKRFITKKITMKGAFSFI